MSDEDRVNLSREDAIEKIRHIAKDQIAMLLTHKAPWKAVARPMATMGIDDDGAFWFMCKKNTPQAEELAAHGHAHLTYSVHSKSEYLALEGDATVLRDQKKIDELWTPIAKTWFHEGKDDPNLLLIKVTPKIGHYWDTKHGKVVQLLGMVVGAVTGKETDDSVEGDVRVKQ